LETAFGGNYETEYNESVDVQLAIGIDYGTVLFDYLGDSFHREFTVLGDHVTYAEQLQGYALRAGENSHQHPAILISPTVERSIRPFLTTQSEREFGHHEAGALAAFGLSREIFDTAEFLKCQRDGSWESKWTEKGLSPPPQREFG
jgi:class 3 adenylate cyclase